MMETIRWELTPQFNFVYTTSFVCSRPLIFGSFLQTQFTDGEVVLTTHRILWGKPGDIPKGLTCLSLHLYYAFCVEEESGGVFGLGGPKRIIIHLGPALPGKRPGPAVASPFHYIKFSFKDGIDSDFFKALTEAIASKAWERQAIPPNDPTTVSQSNLNASPRPSTTPPNSKMRSGIVGIERSIEEQHKATDQSISVAFQDLTKLMEKAKEMVVISKNISTKIRVSSIYPPHKKAHCWA